MHTDSTIKRTTRLYSINVANSEMWRLENKKIIDILGINIVKNSIKNKNKCHKISDTNVYIINVAIAWYNNIVTTTIAIKFNSRLIWVVKNPKILQLQLTSINKISK
jgi:hypothetical protein